MLASSTRRGLGVAVPMLARAAPLRVRSAAAVASLGSHRAHGHGAHGLTPSQTAHAAGEPHWVPFRVSGAGVGAQIKLQARQHEVCVDEPKKLGGSDTGPNPLELCISSLAGCKAATLAHVAKQMGLDVTRVEFPRVEGVIDGRGFQGVAGVYAGIQRVNMEMTLTAAGMTQEQLEELKQRIGTQCPIAATLKQAGTDMRVTVRCGDLVA